MRTIVFILFTLVSFSIEAATQPGSFIFVYGKIIDCGDTVYLLDYAEVPESGKVEFFEGFEIDVSNLREDEIVPRLVNRIEKQTGHKPRTLSVRVVPAADERLISSEMMKLAFEPLACDRRKESSSPPPDIKYIRSLAFVPTAPSPSAAFGRNRPVIRVAL